MFIEKVVIGSTVEAAYYALVNDCVFMDTRKCPPLFYKKLTVPILSQRFDSGAWERVNTMLGLLSRRILLSSSDTIKVFDNKIKIISGVSTFEYTFAKAIIFDSTNLKLNNNILLAKEKSFFVIDDFELSCLGPKRYELEPMVQQSNFAKELHFYSSDRVDGANYITDCILISELTQEQINCFDYSDSIGKILIERYLRSIEIFGSFMKYNPNGTKKYRRPKVVHSSRSSFEKDNNIYENSEFISFVDFSLEQIIEACT